MLMIFADDCRRGSVGSACMGYRRAPSEASGIDVGRKPLHPGLISYVRHSPGKLRQPRPRHPRTSCALPPNPVSLQASWSCSRPIRCGRIAVQPISSDNPSRGRGAVPRTPRRRGLDPARPSHLSRDSDRSRQGERYEAIIRAHGPEILENLNTPNWPEVMSSGTRRGKRRWSRSLRSGSWGRGLTCTERER